MPPEIRELDAGFKIICESDMEKYRADTFWTKEPETIAWIRSFQDGEIFWDIGANIGIYTLFAAKLYPKSSIWAFEPQFLNFMRLVQNVGINNLPNVLPLNLGFSRRCLVTHFFVKENEPGKSGGQLGSPLDEHGKEFKPKEVMPVTTFAIDRFLENHAVPVPVHIKIDVDGREEPIILGMMELLGCPALKSFLVEINPDTCRKDLLLGLIAGYGFSTNNQFNKMDNHSRVRRAKENIKAENIIFTR